MRLRRLVPLALLVGVLALSRSGPAGAAPAEGWFGYEIAPAADLSTLRISMTFDGEPAKRLVLDDGAGAACIVPGTGLSASPAGGYAVAGTKVSYDVDLSRLVSEKDGAAYRVGRDVVARVGRWLLRPAAMEEGTVAGAKFVLPEGIQAATPWTPIAPDGRGGAAYLLDSSTFLYWGWVAFGRFDLDRFIAGDAVVEVARLDGTLAATDDGIRRWITTAIDTVSALYGGKYPRKKLTAFVEPSRARRGAGGDPVSFGATWPGGGGLLVLHVPADTKDAELPGEWVAIHELVHLAMPVVVEEDAWFSEGIATYYQEVLRMRSGHFRERDGWQSLLDGFAFGRSRPPGVTLLEASRTMRKTHAFSWTYWAGAAAMFQADAAIRARSNGAVGLDDAMRRWARLAGGERAYAAEALSMDAEAVAGAPGLLALAAPALSSKEFPDVAATLAALGIDVRGGRVTIVDADTAAASRRAIAAGAPPAAAPGPSPAGPTGPSR